MLAIGNRKSSLRLSALNSVSTYLLPPVYEQFMRDHPDIHLEIQDMTVEAACQSLLRGETDLAFTSDAPRTDAIRAELVMAEPMDLICAAGSCYSDGIGPDELPSGRRCTWSGPTSLPAGIRSYGVWTRCPGSSWRS